jgi:hypothetical protein
MRRKLVEVEAEVEEENICVIGDRVMVNNGIENIWLIIASTNKKNNYFKGIILSKLKYTKQYNYADIIDFSKRNILTKLEDQIDANIHGYHQALGV